MLPSYKRSVGTLTITPLPTFYYACGRYHERALGVLQAMVELNIRSSSTAVSMDKFVSYWDSEAPRIGDAHPSRAGLSQWMEAASRTTAVQPGSVSRAGEESVRLVWRVANLTSGTWRCCLFNRFLSHYFVASMCALFFSYKYSYIVW